MNRLESRNKYLSIELDNIADDLILKIYQYTLDFSNQLVAMDIIAISMKWSH